MNEKENLTEYLYSDRISEFTDLANSLSERGGVENLSVLLLSLKDDYDYYDEMSILMHGVERGEPDQVYLALKSCLPELNSQAPEWCETLVMRFLRALPEVGSRYNAFDFIKAIKSDPNCQKILSDITDRLASEGRVDQVVVDEIMGN